MTFKEILYELNVVAQCKKYRLSLWQCPYFLFLVMGILIIIIVLTSYAIGIRYIEEPEIIALIILFLAGILFLITFIIIRSFERMAEVTRLRMEFTNILIHQLSAPLTNLSWAIEVLSSGGIGKIEGNQMAYLKILKENIQRMREMTQDLITISKIEEKTLFIKKEKISLVKIIQDFIFKFQPSISNLKLKLKFDFPENLPEIFTDPNLIKIVIENLLDNAIRYNKEGGEIKIFLGQKEKNIYFEIKDEGIGILKEDQKFIFQKFFRAKNVISQQPYGSGLGLYITKSILKELAGKISFKSEEGKGSIFWFTLPIK